MKDGRGARLCMRPSGQRDRCMIKQGRKMFTELAVSTLRKYRWQENGMIIQRQAQPTVTEAMAFRLITFVFSKFDDFTGGRIQQFFTAGAAQLNQARRPARHPTRSGRA